MDITRWLEEEERDFLFLVQEAYGAFEMDSTHILVAWASAEVGRLQIEQQLLDEALSRAVALHRPFTEDEVLSPAWQAGYELTPEMVPQFVLHREATRKTPRLWCVVEIAELPF